MIFEVGYIYQWPARGAVGAAALVGPSARARLCGTALQPGLDAAVPPFSPG